MLVSTHYMDEAERCHQIAYISNGRLLVEGTSEEILRASGLRTWEVTGEHLAELTADLTADRQWLVVPFGTRLHVSGDRGEDLADWIDRHGGAGRHRVDEIAPGLEDLFIALTQREPDRAG